MMIDLRKLSNNSNLYWMSDRFRNFCVFFFVGKGGNYSSGNSYYKSRWNPRNSLNDLYTIYS
jgi:hypothetical protein